MNRLQRCVLPSFLLFLFLSILLTERAEAGNEGSLEEVVIELKWRHQFQFAGYYAAVEKGFFADEGLAVTLVERDPSTNIINRVLTGHADYGVSDSILILQQANGAPIALVAAIFQHSANAILSLTQTGIQDPRDLVSRRVGFYDSGAEGVDLLALMASQGVANPNLVRQRWDERIDSLLRGDVDAISIYVTNEPYQIKARGYEFNLMYPRNFGFDFYGDMLFTSASELEQNPERVAAGAGTDELRFYSGESRILNLTAEERDFFSVITCHSFWCRNKRLATVRNV